MAKIGLAYIILLSIIGFVIMLVDKIKAKRGAWRISEKTLLLVAICGGGIGSLLGMRLFRHKTQKVKFKIILPFSGILYLVISIYLMTTIL